MLAASAAAAASSSASSIAGDSYAGGTGTAVAVFATGPGAS